MASKTVQKVCFDAQEMIHSLICSYDLDHTVVSSSWLVLDPKVASWLLDADHPPVTFTELLAKHLPAEENKPVSATSQLSACHSLTMLRSVMKRLFMSLNEAYLWQLFVDVEMKLCPILAAMEVQGLCTRSETLKEYGKLLQERLESIEQQVYKSAGHPFQITSHVQLRHVLFDELGLDKKHQGKRLARTNVQNLKSTSETVLVKLQALHPLPKLVLKYRQLSKLKSTYIDGILDCVQNGYVQTSWEQTSAASGRLQSANPNLQNIPKQPVYLDDEESMIILARRPFVSHVGWSLMTADFQSIELRLLAHLSNDRVLLQVFNKKDSPDIFLELTAQWLGVPASEVGTADRERSKRLVYSIVYGVGPDKLAETLKVSKEEAKSFSKSFLARFPGVGAFTRRCISRCRKHGFVQTILRRRRLIPNINSCDFHNRCYAERQSVNFVVQGSAADICKLAMIRVVQQLALRPQLRARLLVQIHDELLLEVADEDIVEVRGVVKNAMEVTSFCCGPEINIQVPLPVSIVVGKNWSQLSET